ncbi:MAG: restriction endonuclease [Thermodesulfobacteriota bacterium]
MSRKGSRFFRYVIPVLETLQEMGGSASASEVKDRVVEKLGISEKEQAEQLPSGGSRVRNDIGWARFFLLRAGLMEQAGHGVWTLSEKGLSSRLTEAQAAELADRVDVTFGLRKNAPGTKPSSDGMEPPEEAEDLPDYREELLDILKNLPPAGFERICQRLLRESGFERVEVTGKSGDGGIDGVGILQVNPFVSFKVLFQCKRYQGMVSASQVRDFRGAMVGRADKGIILTTGGFTTDAAKEARRDGVTPIELVDGEKLIHMFELQELGLKPVKTFEVDRSFFVEFQQN